MILQLQYPFDPQLILRTRSKIRKMLLQTEKRLIEVRIAVLGGSTTHDIIEILELFLLDYDIKPVFYECEFGQFWQEVMFNNEELIRFKPDIIYIHTSNRNITRFPDMQDSAAEVDALCDMQLEHFRVMWVEIEKTLHCPMIQTNFELPYFRLLGNRDAVDVHGRTAFIMKLNQKFSEYAREHELFHLLDIHSLSAWYGLEKWSDPLFWHMYKYSLCVPAIPYLAHNAANIIKAIYGKNKKAMALDLDNTLWGGVIADDGIDGIEIGHETSMGQVYSEFQNYIRLHKDLGVILNVISKNDESNALLGLNHPEGTLHPDDFVIMKANWENKDTNVRELARELNILPESIVFVDDNPAERGIVSAQMPDAAVPVMEKVEHYIRTLDRSGFFEVTRISEDDIRRNEMYKGNVERTREEHMYQNYDEYLTSLDMHAVIRPFDAIYLPRITQLTNKSNQFNLTTRRYTDSEIAVVASDDIYLTLYGKLSDKHGDNGLVSVVIGKKKDTVLHLELWLMSCRVLKRNMEQAMLDTLVTEAQAVGIQKLIGYYYRTEKNSLVQDFYKRMGFTLRSESEGDSIWTLKLSGYQEMNHSIKVSKGEES